MSLTKIGRLLLPQSAATDALVEADASWDPYPLLGADEDLPIVWGRAPRPSGTSPATLMTSAWRRERALSRLKGSQRFRIHRWEPSQLRRGVVRNRLRAFARAGVVVEHVCSTPRMLDDVAQAAGLGAPIERFRVGSGGVLHTRVTTASSGPGLLKIVLMDSSVTHDDEPAGLRRLEEAGIATVPRLIGAGRIADAVWSLQSVLPGARPDRLTPELAVEVGSFLAGLPRSAGPWTSTGADAAFIAAALPALAKEIGSTAERARHGLAGSPGVLRHGDLWSANLLVENGKLSGVVDWDAWHADGVPGADLLQLVVRERARRRSRPLGALWEERPWLSERFSTVGAEYWPAVGIQPSTGMLEAIGLAWWLNQVAATLSRLPHLASSNAWLEPNVVRVLKLAAS